MKRWEAVKVIDEGGTVRHCSWPTTTTKDIADLVVVDGWEKCHTMMSFIEAYHYAVRRPCVKLRCEYAGLDFWFDSERNQFGSNIGLHLHSVDQLLNAKWYVEC